MTVVWRLFRVSCKYVHYFIDSHSGPACRSCAALSHSRREPEYELRYDIGTRPETTNSSLSSKHDDYADLVEEVKHIKEDKAR